jgi:two-component system nitrate/nitrite sensor histidine kinase NarX
VLIFGFFLPVLMGTILTLLSQTEIERLRVVKQHDLEQELARELSQAVTWDDLSSCLQSFLQKVGPFSAYSLFVFNPQKEHFTVETQWNIPDSTANFIKPILFNQCECFESRRWYSLPIDFFPDKISPAEFTGYCLPLIISQKPTAMLHLFLPSSATLPDDQIQILNDAAPSIAFAIDRLHPLGSTIAWATASAAERQRLARHLHDTLGQNLGFLSLKLDMLKGDDVLGEVAAVREQLAQMHSVANQAYEQVRATLTTLNSPEVLDLGKAIGDLAQNMSLRSGLDIQITRQGTERQFPPLVQKKITGIVGEALANAVKHAQASSVSIELFWGEQLFTISIKDNGWGFAPDVQGDAGHYGLKIMKNRAQEINGRLTIHSEPQRGTAVLLEVPY